MKLLPVLGIIVVLAVVASAQRSPSGPKLPKGFPGYGPFNPRAPPRWNHRFRRDNGQIHAHTNIHKGQPVSTSLDYEKKIFENGYGTVTGFAGMQHNQRVKPEAHGGVRGIFTFGGKGQSKSELDRYFDAIMEQRRQDKVWP